MQSLVDPLEEAARLTYAKPDYAKEAARAESRTCRPSVVNKAIDMELQCKIPAQTLPVDRQQWDKLHAPLVARGVGKSYGEDEGELNQVIVDVSFSLRAGEIVSLMGPSGCGKTTLLNLMSGLTQPTRGAVLWHGQALDDVPKGVGYLLQKDMLMPWRNVLANVTLGLELTGMSRAHREKKAHAMLGKVGLAPYYIYYPSLYRAACVPALHLRARWRRTPK